MEELVEAEEVFPDHLEVTVTGAPRLNVLYREVELKESVVGIGRGIRPDHTSAHTGELHLEGAATPVRPGASSARDAHAGWAGRTRSSARSVEYHRFEQRSPLVWDAEQQLRQVIVDGHHLKPDSCAALKQEPCTSGLRTVWDHDDLMPVALGSEPGDEFSFATRVDGIRTETDHLDSFRRARTAHLGIASERNHNNGGISGFRQLNGGFHSPLPGITTESDNCVDARWSIARGPHKQPGGRNQEDNDHHQHDEDDALEFS